MKSDAEPEPSNVTVTTPVDATAVNVSKMGAFTIAEAGTVPEGVEPTF
jgi:hypothetical protein